MLSEKAKKNLRYKFAEAIDKAQRESGCKSPVVHGVEVGEATRDALLEAYDGTFEGFWFPITVNEDLAYPQMTVKVGEMTE
jgi:hypothetical protein